MESLKVTSLVKDYIRGERSVRVLDHVDLVVDQGEFVAIMGTSGSGKTTLLNIIAGIDDPTAGCVYINGVELTSLSREEKTEYRRGNIGFIFQNYNLLPVLNGYENIILPSRLDEQDVNEELLAEIIDALDIEEQLVQLPDIMSGGEQQRVAIARAVYTRPKIILADEPTGSLDSVASRTVIKLLKQMRERYDQTIMIVTHDHEVAKAADRILYIEDGKIQTKKQ